MNSIETARSIAIEFATELNNTPNELENWHQMDVNDNLPEFDYIALRQQFGEVTREMERAYKTAFNSTFRQA